MLKDIATAKLGREGERATESAVQIMGHKWRPAEGSSPGIDGFIEILQGNILSGILIAVQIKSGRSYLTNRKLSKSKSPRVPLSRRTIRIERNKLSYLLAMQMPSIVVWYDNVSKNLFWGVPKSVNISVVNVPSVLDHTSGRRISGIARSWHSILPTIDNPQFPQIPVKSIKDFGQKFYNELRYNGVSTIAFGSVSFTLRGWRHITRQNRHRDRVLRSLLLLGAGVEILKNCQSYHLARTTKRGHRLYKLVARVQTPLANDRVVAVIIEEIKQGCFQFLSVYEQSKQ